MTDTTTNTAITQADTVSFGVMDQRRAARMAFQARVDDKFVTSDTIQELIFETQSLVDSMMTTMQGKHPEGRILAVVGESGAGKSWAVQHALGQTLSSTAGLVVTTAPAPCTLKQLGRDLLDAMGYKLTRDLPEHITWERVRAQLKATCTRIVWIDEMHHALTNPNPKEQAKVSETLKNIVQQRDWPVSLILSGLPTLSTFIGRDFQLGRRSMTVCFDPIRAAKDVKDIAGMMTGIIERHAGMHTGGLITPEFASRVIHAAEGGLGNIITLTRLAIYRAFDRAGEGATLEADDFAKVYRRLRCAEDDQNVFMVPNWDQIVVHNSRLRDEEKAAAIAAAAVDQARAKPKKKGAK